jgi:hypothetical protein
MEVGAIAAVAAGTLSRLRMLVAAAPATSKPVIAMMAIALVKPLSVSFRNPSSLSRELGDN